MVACCLHREQSPNDRGSARQHSRQKRCPSIVRCTGRTRPQEAQETDLAFRSQREQCRPPLGVLWGILTERPPDSHVGSTTRSAPSSTSARARSWTVTGTFACRPSRTPGCLISASSRSRCVRGTGATECTISARRSGKISGTRGRTRSITSVTLGCCGGLATVATSYADGGWLRGQDGDHRSTRASLPRPRPPGSMPLGERLSRDRRVSTPAHRTTPPARRDAPAEAVASPADTPAPWTGRSRVPRAVASAWRSGRSRAKPSLCGDSIRCRAQRSSASPSMRAFSASASTRFL